MNIHDRRVDALEIIRKSVSSWISHNASSSGAALAFYTLFAIAPILVVVVAVGGAVLGERDAQAHVLAEMRALIGENGAAAIQSLLASAHHRQGNGWTAAAGIMILMIGATSVFAELQDALNVIWNTPARTGAKQRWWQLLRQRFLSFGMILGVGFLLLISLLGFAALGVFGGWLGSFVEEWRAVLWALDVTFSFAITTLLFAMIYKFIPRETITWGDVWIGALVTAALLTIGKTLIGFYLGRNAFVAAYGAAGSFVVLLLWVYYAAQVFLLGAEFTHVFAYRHGSHHLTASAEAPARADADAPV
ncbi:MAG: YihY/virulence factor BrkB family protein [Steroidobacteraceae bacterium]|jgi:membrane protein